MRLEPRRVLNASAIVPLVDVADGGDVTFDGHGGVTIGAGVFADDGQADVFHVSRHGEQITVSLAGNVLFSGRSGDITSLTIRGSSDADHLAVHLGGDGPIGALRFDAGDSNANDTISLMGDAGRVGHVWNGTGDGIVAAAGTRIHYDDVEILRDVVTTAHRSLDLGGIDTATLSSSAETLRLDAEGNRLVFAESSRLSIDLVDGTANRFDVNGLGNYEGDVSIVGDRFDTVGLSGTSDLGDGDLTVAAGTIDINGDVRTDGGDLRFNAVTELRVDADANLDSDGGFIELNAGRHGDLDVAGRVDVSDDDGAGGEARLLGRNVHLSSSAVIDADGRFGGGTILVGGDYQGANNDVLNALRTTIEHGAVLTASSDVAGDGGRIIVWADGATHFAGAVLARGGDRGGDGGFVEVSGKQALAFLGTADLAAPHGRGGTLLLDPRTITIVELPADADIDGDGETGDDLADPGDLDDAGDFGNVDSIISASAIVALLENGQSVILAASDLIQVDAAIDVETGSANLTFAADVVAINADITIGGTFVVQADALQLDGDITTPGTVILTTLQEDTLIDLGGADVLAGTETLGLTNAELQRVSAAVLQVGSATAGSISLTADITSPANLLRLMTQGSVTGAIGPAAAGITATTLVISAGDGVDLRGNNAVGTIEAMIGGATGDIIFVDRDGNLTVGGIETGGGDVSLTTTGTLNVSTAIELDSGDASLVLAGDVVLVTADVSAPGSITVRADALTIGNGVTVATPGVVTLTTFQASTEIDLGGNDVLQGNETLGLTNAELQRVSASVLQIGSTTAGDIELTANITSPADVLRLVSAGTITSTGPASAAGPGLTAEALVVSAAGLTLVGNNQISSIAGTITGGTGEFRLANRVGNLEITTVDGVSGITTAGGDVAINVAGVLTISSDLTSNGGEVRLATTGATQLAGGEIDAGSGSITIVNGVLRGSGTMTGDVVVASNATMSPGTATTAGMLTINGDLTFQAGSTYFASIHDDRTNPPDAPVAGDDYDQIVVTGDLSIQTTGAGATLTIAVANGSQIDAGDGYQLIDVDGTVTGAFDNHPEAEIIEDFGGSSHDVALTYAAGGLLVQVVGPLVFTPTPDGAATNIRIVRNGAYVEFYVNGAFVTSNLLVAATGITVVGADGENDTLTVDFSGGGFGRAIAFDGGAGGDDELILTGGGTFDTVTHNFTNASSGSIELDSATIDDVITYSGLEPIDDNLSATNRVFQFNGGSETITLVDAAAANEMTIDSTHGESVTFTNPTASLTINAGTGEDEINILSVDTGFDAALSIVGGPQSDVVTVSAALALGSGSVTGHLAVTAESIIIAANLSTDGGADAGNITLTGNVALAADIVFDTNVAGGGGDGTVTITGTLDADSEGNGRDLTIDAGSGDVSFGAIVGGDEQLGSITIIAAENVEFAAAVHLTGGLTQSAGTGTTTLHGGTIGGNLALTTDRVAFAAGTLTVTGAATVSAGSGIVGGTANGVADLSAASIVLNVTGAGNDGIGTVGTPLEVASPGVIDVDTSAGNGDVFLHTIGDMRIGRTNAGGGDATLSTTGAIIDALAGDGAGNENLVASTATLTAVAGVGSGDAIDTRVDVLDVVNTTSGGITIAEVDGITVTALVQQGNPADGAILLSAGGTITLDGNISTGAASAVRLVAGNAIAQSSGAITGGSLGVTALNNINLLGTANDVDVFAGRSAEGSLAFADADGFTLGTVAAAGTFTGASGAEATGGNVTLRSATGPLILDADVTASGAVRLNSGGSITQQSGTITGVSLGVIAANNVTLDAAANDVAVFAANTGGNVVFVDTNGVTIGSVVAAAGFAGGATGVTGGAITLRMGTGNLQINEGINASGAVRLSAESGFVRQAGDAGIIATSLGVRTGIGGIDLASASNDVDVFAAASGGEVVYRDATAFTVGSIAGTSLFTATAGVVVLGVGEFPTTDITLVAVAGPLTLNADVSTDPLGTVRLVSGAGIMQTGGAITARDLGIIAAGNVSLLSAGNSVDTFAAESAGNVFYRNTGFLTIGGVAANGLFGGAGGVSTGGGDVLLVSSNDSLLIFDTIDAGTGTVRLSAAGWIEQDDAVVLAGALGARAGIGVILLEEGNDVDTFAAFAGDGIVFYQDADDLTIGNVAAFATPGLFGETHGIVALDNGETVEVLLVTGQGGAAGNGDLTIQSQISALGGTVLINVDGNVSQAGAISTQTLGVFATNGTVELFGSNDVDVFAAETDGGSIGFADVDDVVIGLVFGFHEGYFPGVAGVVSNGGDIVIVAGSLTVAEAVQSSGGTILLQADAMNLQAAIDATAAGIVQLTVRSNGTGITLGGGGGLSLGDAELDQITARHLAIGGVAVDATGNGPAVSAGRITIAAGITLGNVTNLSFLTAADVYGAVTDAITIGGAIVFDVGTGVSGVGGFDGTYLAVDTGAGVAGRVRGTGEFRVSSFGDTTVGLAAPIDPIAVAGQFAVGLTSVTTANGTIALEALFGNLTVDGDLAVQGANADLILQAIGFPLFAIEGNVFLNATISSDRDILLRATDDIVQADGNLIDAEGVRMTADGQIGTAANAIDLNAGRVSAATTGGSVYLNEVAAGGQLVIGTVGGQAGIAAGGVVNVTTEAGNLVVNQAIVAGSTVMLNSTDGLTSAPTGTVNGQTVTLLAVNDVSLEGTVISNGSTTITSSMGGVTLAGANVGGLLDVDANGGSIEVTGAAVAGGAADFDAVGTIRVLNGGSLSGNSIDLNSGMRITLAGLVHSNTTLQAVAVENVVIAATVSAGGVLSIDAGGTINSTPAGALAGNVVDLQAASNIILNGSLSSNGPATVHSIDGNVSISGASVGGLLDVDADHGRIDVTGNVFVAGQVDFDAASVIFVTNTGSLRGAQIDLLAGNNIGLNGNVTAAVNMLTVTTASGSITVSSSLTAAGVLDLNAAQGNISVSGSGLLDGRRVDIDAGGRVDLAGRTNADFDIVVASGAATTIGGRMSAGTSVTVDSGAALSVSDRINAGGLVQLRSSTLTVSPGGAIAGAIVDAVAKGAVRLSGPVASVLGTTIVSTGAGVDIDAVMTSNRGISIVANGGGVTLDALLTAGTHASIAAAGNVVIGSGAVRANDVQLLAGGTASIGGGIVAHRDASIVTVGGGISTSAVVAAGRNASLIAGGGHLLLGGNVQAGMIASLRSPHGSILQPSGLTTVTAVAARFVAGGSVGQAGGAIDLDVVQVAATATGGGAWLHQQGIGGTLTVAILGADRGVRSVGETSISTANGDLRLAAPVRGTTIELVADRVAGSAQRGRVLFEGGYAETPTGRIVATPPRNIPVDANGVPITRFDLASPFVVSFGILAGNTADTVDGRLSDFGTTVTVDFVQPELFDPTQRRIQSLTDRGSGFVNGIFAPFRFQYSELFLQERLIFSGAREQLFDITITATQDDSISIAEKLAGVTIVDATKQTVTFGNVSTSPTEQSLTVPLGIVSPIVASIEIPVPPPEEPQPPPSTPTAYVAAPTAVAVERAGVESSGASAGATSTDRPRLFLVWMRPGQEGPPATIEIDLIWFAREYQRQLIGHLKEGRYWFELAEPGSPARQLGDSFYVRNGLVIDDPAAENQGEAAAEQADMPLLPGARLAPVDDLPPPVVPAQPAAADESIGHLTSPAAAAAMGAVTVLGSRWRRRLIAAREEDERPAPLGRLARFSRQIRRVAALPVDEQSAGCVAIADETAEATGRW